MERIPLTRPFYSDEIGEAVLDVLTSGHWTEGSVTAKFEQNFSSYLGGGEVIAVTSCTTGLELALRALSIGFGDEVIIPGFTHPATACAVWNVGATAVVVDIDPETLLIDYDALEEAITPLTKAAIPVSLFGNPLDWQVLAGIQERHKIRMVEDAACSAGAEYANVKVGTQAELSVFSLHPRKMLSTGEGGLIVTTDPSLARWLRSYKQFGAENQTGSHLPCFVRPGTNAKMSDILAAVGVAQLSILEQFLTQREFICNTYERLLAEIDDIRWQRTTAGGRHSRQSFCLLLDKRNAILNTMREKNIEVQIGTYSLDRQPVFRNNPLCRFPRETKFARQAFDRSLVLPLYHDMQEDVPEKVVQTLLEVKKSV